MSRAIIEEAKQAYQNGTPIMSDEAYDALTSDDNGVQGVRPKNSVSLPFYLGSLDKIKYKKSTSRLDKFTGKLVLQDKLDGVSALYIHPKLYTRGDGFNGRDISHLLPSLNLPIVDFPVRGELILTKADFSPEMGNDARSTVAGIINSTHDKSQDAKGARFKEILGKIQFVAYAVMGTNHNIVKQYQMLKPFKRPWAKLVDSVDEEYLLRALNARREKSPYKVDGIVIAKIGSYEYPSGSNPKHMIAFKQDSSVITTVTQVTWSIKKDGQLFPKVHFNPVDVFGATISCASGKNAKFIKDSGIGNGAKVMVTRANDVIPDITGVVEPVEPDMPDIDCHWDGPRLVADDPSSFKEYAVERMLHFVKTLKVHGLSRQRLGHLHDAGVTTAAQLFDMDPSVLGEKLTVQILESLETARENATQAEFMAASGLFPGLGVKKLSNPEKLGPKGREVFNANIDKYKEWAKTVGV